MEKMRALECLKGCTLYNPQVLRDISFITYDSRQATDGCAFFAFDGIHTDGNLYIPGAIEKGADLIVTEKTPSIMNDDVCYAICDDARRLYAQMSCSFFDHPSDRLKIIAVTGTDGKSTTCDFIHQLLPKTGLISTVYIDDGKGKRLSPFRQSTPEAFFINRILSDCVKNGLERVIIEATSHALSEKNSRLEGIDFDVAVITTITEEHLDFHRTLEDYIDSKLNIIRKLKKDGIFITTDRNPLYRRCMELAAEERRWSILVGTSDMKSSFGGVNLPFMMPCICSNAVLAWHAACQMEDVDIRDIGKLTCAKGRCEFIRTRSQFQVMIDFAHTADAYANIFPAARARCTGNLIAVSGCAGERDVKKRLMMGRTASHYADVMIITDEDPRKEDRRKIAQDMISGFDRDIHYEVIDDRRSAIRHAISIARPGDFVLLLGKGHERSMELPEGTVEWDEEKEVLDALEGK